MRARRFAWEGPNRTAAAIRAWTSESAGEVDVAPIAKEVREGGDAAVLALTARFDAIEAPPSVLRVEPEAVSEALADLDPALREAMEAAAGNVRAVADFLAETESRLLFLEEGHSIAFGEAPVGAAGIYAPGGKAAYPSSVLMGAIPARAADVERVVLATPPGPDGRVNRLTLAAAALCEVDEVYAMGGAQAIFALAFGTETVAPVDVVAGPGNAWVREAKRAVYGQVGVDSLAGPSELMLIADESVDPEWAALDLCAQAEHGGDGALLVVAPQVRALDAIAAATEAAAAARPGVGDAPLALVLPPDADAATSLANAFAPEHLELLVEEPLGLADAVRTAGCVFTGANGATAFGDYAAGSNHVLPTGGAGRFTGPLGPSAFRRGTARVDIPPEAAARLAPTVEALARAEGFPVHGESAMIRASDAEAKDE